MRSRFTAYALGEVDYIIETTDPEGPIWEPDLDAWRASIAEFSRSCDFRGLTILEHSMEGNHGEVRFRADILRGRDDVSFEEHSEFVHRQGGWLYRGPK